MTTLIIALTVAVAVSAPDNSVRVSGEDLSWKIETPHMIVDLTKNPGTGRSGQINTILLREPPVLFTRDRPTSTLHLSPNAAIGRNWIGVNRWNPPSTYRAFRTPPGFRIEREGEMPGASGLWVETAYEFSPAEPVIRVEESVEATAEVRVRLLRLCEWSFAPGTDHPFTHLAWEDAGGDVHLKSRTGEEAVPLDVRWQAFLNIQRGFGFAAVNERLDLGESPLLSNAASHFAGDPHYFYRALIMNEEGSLVTIPHGQRYSMRYRIYCFRPSADDPTEPVSRYYRSLHAGRQPDN